MAIKTSEITNEHLQSAMFSCFISDAFWPWLNLILQEDLHNFLSVLHNWQEGYVTQVTRTSLSVFQIAYFMKQTILVINFLLKTNFSRSVQVMSWKLKSLLTLWPVKGPLGSDKLLHFRRINAWRTNKLENSRHD